MTHDEIRSALPYGMADNYQFHFEAEDFRLDDHVHPAYVATAWAKGDKDKAIGWLNRRMSEVKEFPALFLDSDQDDEWVSFCGDDECEGCGECSINAGPYFMSKSSALTDLAAAVQLIQRDDPATDLAGNPLRSAI